MPLIEHHASRDRRTANGYALLAFDRDGVEAHDPDGLPVTDRQRRPGVVRRTARRVSERVFSGTNAPDPARTSRSGDERRLLSAALVAQIRDARARGEAVTDLFIACHGWLTDYERAIVTYDA